jgi:hypothetical protein
MVRNLWRFWRDRDGVEFVVGGGSGQQRSWVVSYLISHAEFISEGVVGGQIGLEGADQTKIRDPFYY